MNPKIESKDKLLDSINSIIILNSLPKAKYKWLLIDH